MTSQPAYIHDPYDLEKSVLGCLILDANSLADWRYYAGLVTNAKFDLMRSERNRIVLDAVLELYAKDVQPDFAAVIDWLKTTNRLDAVGGPGYVTALSQSVWSTANCRDYLKLLHDRWRRTQVEKAQSEMEEAMTSGIDVNVAAVQFADTMKRLVVSDSSVITPSAEAILGSAERLSGAHGDENRALPSGFPSFQRMVGGYVRGQIVTVGTFPGGGKTAFAMQEIDFILRNSNANVYAFLTESDIDQYLARYCSRTYHINANKWNSKEFSQTERQQIVSAAKQVSQFENRLFIAERGVYNAAQIESKVLEIESKTGKPCDFLVIDYLQRLAPASKGQSASEHRSLHDNMEIIFGLAAKKNAAVLLLSQITMESIRESFSKKDKRPGIGAFKGSGSVIEASKVCMLIYKDDQKHLKDKIVEQEFIVCKANDGATGAIPSLFIKPYTLHIEDTCFADRAPYHDALQRYGFDPHKVRGGHVQTSDEPGF